jgi:hypothetical protein
MTQAFWAKPPVMTGAMRIIRVLPDFSYQSCNLCSTFLGRSAQVIRF